MREYYRLILKDYFHGQLITTRKALGLTQSQMAERLMMDDRSYSDLDHGKSCCSVITLIWFLMNVSTTPREFLEGLTKVMLEAELDYMS